MPLRPAIRIILFLVLASTPFVAPLAAQTSGLPGGSEMWCPEEGCPVTYDVNVTPDNGSMVGRTTNTGGYSAQFTVTNTGSATDQFTIACVPVTANVTCTGTSVTTMTLGASDDSTITAYFNVGAVGTGTLKIRATSVADPWDFGAYTVNVVAPPSPAVMASPGAGSRTVVHTRQPVLRALFPAPASGFAGAALTWRGQSVTGIARQSKGLIEWEVDSTTWLRTGLPGFSGADSGLAVVTLYAGNGGYATTSQWVVLPNDSTPVLGFSAMPLESVNGGFSAPFGPGLSVTGAEVETGFSIPSYSSMGAARSAGLVYSTRQSYPRALVQVDLDLPWPATSASSIKLVLVDGSIRLDSLVLASLGTACLTGTIRRCRATLQGDFAATGGGTPAITRKWLTVEATVTSGAVTKMSADSVEAVLVDRRGSRYGSGWWPSGVSQLVGQGSDRILVGPTGSATIFRGHGDSVYIGPPGTFTTLAKTATGWELQPRGSLARVFFDTQGRLIKSVDANGNRDSVAYEAATDKVVSLTDPVGKTITFSYDGAGTLTGFTDPASRQSTVTINATNQLTRRWLASPATRPDTVVYSYRIYPGTKTVLLRRRQGVLGGDSTSVLYDSTFRRRPVGVRLPRVQNEAGTWQNSVITYTAAERQGHGALRSLDSVYVEMKDPRSHWTRSLLTRWAQARHSWDSLGVLSRAAFDPDGFLLWSEGKNGDSSRVHHAYDAARRLVKTFINRGATTGSHVLRTDSLIYDGNHRVIQRMDARGKSAYFAYDVKGNLTMTRTPNGIAWDTAFTWYQSDGLVSSTRRTGDAVAVQYGYDATWKQLAVVVNQAGQTLTTNTYDNLGRLASAVKRSEIRQSESGGPTTTYQWARNETFYAVDNLVDSARTLLSDTSQVAGYAPSWPSASDTARTWRVSHRYDIAGRDTARVNNRGVVTRYQYDRMHRLVARWPWADSTAVKDSTVYDVAGNVKKTITRRGITITHAYDSRNRDTLTVIPGVGNVRRTFGGPLDQLTRVWLVNAVDSIGGVNGEKRMGYDARGRLKADTAYTGAIARASSYSYDTYERPTTLVDPLGTWVTKYEAVRGFVDTLITPMGDTVGFAVDAQGRGLAPRILSGGRRVDGSRLWKANHSLDEARTWVFVGADSFTAGRVFRSQVDIGEFALLPQWSQQAGLGQATQTLMDSTLYDAWGRLLGWEGTKNAVQIGAEAYTFDRTGNINQPTGLANYHATTDRLLGRANGGGRDSLRYDRAGNLIQLREASGGPIWDYDYDALERLVSVRRGGTLIARYGYDILGQRIAKRVYSSGSGGTVGYTRFVYRGGQVSFETDSAGVIGLKYTYSGTDRLLAITDGAAHYYVITDKLGSVRTLIKRDGTWLLSQRFGPYGERIARDTSAAFTLGNRLRYGWTGREYDAETGFSFHRARYFLPILRRWTQEDPIGYAGGGNLYAYAGGTPLEARDPGGLQTELQGSFQGFCTMHSCVSAFGSISYGAQFTIDGVSAGGGGGFSGMIGVGMDIVPGMSANDWQWQGMMVANEVGALCAADRAPGSSCDKFADYLDQTAEDAQSDDEFIVRVGREVAGFEFGWAGPFGEPSKEVTGTWHADGFRSDLVDDDHPWQHFSGFMVLGYQAGYVEAGLIQRAWEAKGYLGFGSKYSASDIQLGLFGIGVGYALKHDVVSRGEIGGWVRKGR